MSYRTKWGNRMFVKIMANGVTKAEIAYFCRWLVGGSSARWGKDPDKTEDAEDLLALVRKMEPHVQPDHAEAGYHWLLDTLLTKDRRSVRDNAYTRSMGVHAAQMVHFLSVRPEFRWVGRIEHDNNLVAPAFAAENRFGTLEYSIQPWQSGGGFWARFFPMPLAKGEDHVE